MILGVMDDAAGFLITFTRYGERLHGDDRGSVERAREDGQPDILPANSVRQAAEYDSLKSAPAKLGHDIGGVRQHVEKS